MRRAQKGAQKEAPKEAQKEFKRNSTEEGFLDSRKYNAESSKSKSKETNYYREREDTSPFERHICCGRNNSKLRQTYYKMIDYSRPSTRSDIVKV